MGMEKEIPRWRIIGNVLHNIFIVLIYIGFFCTIYDMWDEIVNGGLGGFLFLMLPVLGIIFYTWAFIYRRQWLSIRR